MQRRAEPSSDPPLYLLQLRVYYLIGSDGRKGLLEVREREREREKKLEARREESFVLLARPRGRSVG